MSDPLTRLENLKESALQAALDKNSEALFKCLRNLSRKTPSKEHLELSGVGFLLSDLPSGLKALGVDCLIQ